jgi:tetratricopeptide (TPR) repeat protein
VEFYKSISFKQEERRVMIARERVNQSVVLLYFLGLAGSMLWIQQLSISQMVSSSTIMKVRPSRISIPLINQSNEMAEAGRLNQQFIELHKQGKYSEALPLAKKILAIKEKLLSPEDPDVANSLNNLSALYYEQGKEAQAEPLLRHALAIQEKALGPDHPHVAISLNNLATLHYKQGNYAQAEPLFRRALAIREKALGLDHPKVADSLNRLAMLYQKQGKEAQAEPLFRRAQEIKRRN